MQEDSELVELAEEELQICSREIERLEAALVNALIPQDEADDHSAVLEVRAGETKSTSQLLYISWAGHSLLQVPGEKRHHSLQLKCLTCITSK